jgi:hypothetical protein
MVEMLGIWEPGRSLSGHVSPPNRNSTSHWRSIQSSSSVQLWTTFVPSVIVIYPTFLRHIACHRPLWQAESPLASWPFSKAHWIVPVLLRLNRNTSRCTCAGFSPPETNSHLAKTHFVNAKEMKTAAISSSAPVQLPASPSSSSSLS